jgi:hypothetical protein
MLFSKGDDLAETFGLDAGAQRQDETLCECVQIRNSCR